jgi:hypothetical protein
MNAQTTQTGGGFAPRVIYSDIDGQNRQFIYTLNTDGSAMSQEITRHLSYAGSMRETYRERHDSGSEMAMLIHRLSSQSPLPSGWY